MTTFKGRVVYKRKLHRMRYSDVARIAETVSPVSTVGPGEWFTEAVNIERTLLAAQADFLRLLQQIPISSLPTELTIKLAVAIVDLLGKILAEGAAAVVSGIKEGIAKLGLENLGLFGSPSHVGEIQLFERE